MALPSKKKTMVSTTETKSDSTSSDFVLPLPKTVDEFNEHMDFLVKARTQGKMLKDQFDREKQHQMSAPLVYKLTGASESNFEVGDDANLDFNAAQQLYDCGIFIARPEKKTTVSATETEADSASSDFVLALPKTVNEFNKNMDFLVKARKEGRILKDQFEREAEHQSSADLELELAGASQCNIEVGDDAFLDPNAVQQLYDSGIFIARPM